MIYGGVAELTSGREFILSQLYKAGAGLVIDKRKGVQL